MSQTWKKVCSKGIDDGELEKVIDQTWALYDVDNSGGLDKEETRKFVQGTLVNIYGYVDEFSSETFDQIFESID